jgi:hypothetical protein
MTDASPDLPWRGIALALRRPESRTLLDHWVATRGDRRYPPHADLAASPFAALCDRLVLLRVASRPADFRYVHFGTVFRRQHGFDMTGKTVGDWPPAILPGALAAYASAMAAGGLWYLHSAPDADGKSRATEKIYLPFAADFAHVDHILVGTFEVVD